MRTEDVEELVEVIDTSTEEDSKQGERQKIGWINPV